MNPLHWKRDQQIALVLAAGSGGTIGLLYGIASASPIFGAHDCRSLVAWLLYDVCGSFAHSWFPILGWPIFGASLGGVIICIWRLMQESR
jgi:hypothetical protein